MKNATVALLFLLFLLVPACTAVTAVEERAPLARWVREQWLLLFRSRMVQQKKKQVHATLRTLELPLVKTRDVLARCTETLLLDLPDWAMRFVRSHLRQTSMRVPYRHDIGTLDQRHYRVTMVDRGFGPQPHREASREETRVVA